MVLQLLHSNFFPYFVWYDIFIQYQKPEEHMSCLPKLLLRVRSVACIKKKHLLESVVVCSLIHKSQSYDQEIA